MGFSLLSRFLDWGDYAAAELTLERVLRKSSGHREQCTRNGEECEKFLIETTQDLKELYAALHMRMQQLDIFYEMDDGQFVSLADICVYHRLAKVDNDELNEYIVDRDDIEVPDFAIHYAAREGATDLVTRLLNDTGSDPERTTPLEGSNALHEAALKGHTGIVQALIGRKVNLNAVDKNEDTALHYASSHGHLAAAKALVDAGAQFNVQSDERGTPLHYAATARHLQIVDLLLSKGAAINYKDEEGKTPLMLAVGGLMVKPREPGELIAIIDRLVNAGTNLEARDYVGDTALAIAARKDETLAMQKLIHLGADVETEDDKGRTPLYHAVAESHNDAVRILLNDGHADPNHARREEDEHDRSILHRAIHTPHVRIVKMLLDAGANINSRDWYDNTPLHEAIEYCEPPNKPMVETLLERGARNLLQNSSKDTPLHCAIVKKAADVALLILRSPSTSERARNIFMENDAGKTPPELANRSCVSTNDPGYTAWQEVYDIFEGVESGPIDGSMDP